MVWRAHTATVFELLALNNLGLLYARGEGVAQDYERAAGYFAQAATLGLRTAMTNLGVLYENGFGVPVDEAYAHELYRLGGGADDPGGGGCGGAGWIFL